MKTLARDQALKQLYDAFASVEKPSPLATYTGSHCNEEVDVFNQLDWENVSYNDYVDGMEGSIICPAITKLYLLPRLFKMVMRSRSDLPDDAVDNLSSVLEWWPSDPSVEELLSDSQKKAIIAAWAYLDCYLYHPSGSHVARKFAKHWGLEK